MWPSSTGAILGIFPPLTSFSPKVLQQQFLGSEGGSLGCLEGAFFHRVLNRGCLNSFLEVFLTGGTAAGWDERTHLQLGRKSGCYGGCGDPSLPWEEEVQDFHRVQFRLLGTCGSASEVEGPGYRR